MYLRNTNVFCLFTSSPVMNYDPLGVMSKATSVQLEKLPFPWIVREHLSVHDGTFTAVSLQSSLPPCGNKYKQPFLLCRKKSREGRD